jgi:hypothetical protein
MEIRNLLASKAGKRIAIIMLILVVIGIIIFLILSRPTPQTTPNIDTEIYDPVSGDTFRVIDQEPEEPHDMVHMLGFRIFNEIGFTSQQQHIIFTTIQDFFTENYPDIRRLSVPQDSIEYDLMNEDFTYFRLVANTEETFRVRIDIDGSMLRAKISIYDSSGNLLKQS